MKKLSFIALYCLAAACSQNPNLTDGKGMGTGVFKEESIVANDFKLTTEECKQGLDPRLKAGMTAIHKTVETDSEGLKYNRSLRREIVSMSGRRIKVKVSTLDDSAATISTCNITTVNGVKLAGPCDTEGSIPPASINVSMITACKVKEVMKQVETKSTSMASENLKSIASNPSEVKDNVKVTQELANPVIVRKSKGKYTFYNGKTVNAVLTESSQSGEIICNGESMGMGELKWSSIETPDVVSLELYQTCPTTIVTNQTSLNTLNSISAQRTSEILPQ